MSSELAIKLPVDADANDSDATLRHKAASQVDFVLRMIGEQTARRLWERLAGVLGSSEELKETFLNDAGDDMVETTPAGHRAEVEESIYAQLKSQRADRISRN